MRNTRAFSILATLLLLFQLSGAAVETLASSTTSIRDNDKEIVDVKQLNKDEDTINWEVIVNAVTDDTDELEAKLMFGKGLTHSNITVSENVETQKEGNGYTILLPPKDEAYKIELETVIEDVDEAKYELWAEVTLEGEVFSASDVVVNEIKEEKEGVVDKSDEKEEPSETVDETNVEEETTEKTSPKVNEPKPEEPKVDEQDISEIGEVSRSVFNKSSSPIALRGQSDGENWPDPGSLKLDKTATETGNFAEWEVELEVEGKNLKTSSDIVIVFDRSNSMIEGGRAPKAKAAAKEFVNSLLVDSDSTVRIALVPFGSDTGTVNDPHTQFQGFGGKNTLLNAIDAIQIYSTHASGGTNIHAGLHAADEMLSNSTADQKTIVLMSDGEPTYSIKANGYDKPYTWPDNRYDFILKDFDYSNRVGNGTTGNKPNYGWNPYYCGLFQTCYDPHVNDHVIPTISEAKHIMDKGIGIYSVGLEVGNVPDAIYTLQNSQNKGYYQGGSDDMSPIFEEIAASIGFAATQAKVTDPLGNMFDLVKDGSYSGANFEASHGTVSWDDSTETFTWDIGNVKEDEVYTLKYRVTIDCLENPEANKNYPTNKTTTLNYKNHNGNDASKNFPMPEVSVSTGKITKLGYRVNVDGDPVDSNGDVVSSPDEAEQFYKEVHGVDLELNQNYSVPAGDTPDGYQLHVGDDPTEITITNVCNVVEFGYVKTSELPAGKVTAEYVDEDGNTVAGSEEFDGDIGETYTTVQKDIDGYEFVKMHENSADATGVFTSQEQTVIYVYKQLKGNIKLVKVDEDNNSIKLAGAKFNILDGNGDEVGTLETSGNGVAISESLPVGDYTLEEIEAPYGYELSTDQTLTVTVKADKKAKITVTNKQLQGSVKIIKVDADDNTVLLEDAVFELQDEGGNKVATAGKTNSDGEYVFDNIAVGKYKLVETKAPGEYRLLKNPIDVEITPDDLNITETIENTKQGWEIPKTGGIGALGFYGVGLLLIFIALWFVIRRRNA